MQEKLREEIVPEGQGGVRIGGREDTVGAGPGDEGLQSHLGAHWLQN